jgi:hypothetical protein
MNSYGIIMDKRNYPGNEFWKITKFGSLEALKVIASHHDEIAGYLPKAKCNATKMDSVTLKNIKTGQDEPGGIYELASI